MDVLRILFSSLFLDDDYALRGIFYALGESLGSRD